MNPEVELRQLRTSVVVVGVLNFTRAALTVVEREDWLRSGLTAAAI